MRYLLKNIKPLLFANALKYYFDNDVYSHLEHT